MTDSSYMSDMSNLPDPIRQPEFYASVPSKRFVAWIVDTIVILLLTLLTLPFTAFLSIFFFPILLFAIGFSYRVVTLANSSATWGMRLMAIEMRQANGQRFDLATAFWHTLGYTLSFAFFLAQIVSIVLMLSTSRGQGLSDHALGTTALNRRR